MRTSRAGAALVAGLALAVYAATLSPNLSAAHDAVAYMNLIDGGEPAFHPHHLLFAPLAQLWIAALRHLGVSAASSQLVALLDACAGAAGLALVYALLRRRAELGAALSAAATLCVGASFGFWFYSVSVEVYLLPLALVLGALYVLLGRGATGRRFATAGALHAAAVLFHQLHVLFWPSVVWAAWRAARGSGRVPFARALGAHAAAFAPIVLGAYGLVLGVALQIDSLDAALRYAASYALGPDYWYPPSLASAARALVGAGRALIGAHFVFALPELRGVLASALPGQGLADEVYLVRGLAPGLAWLLLAATLALALGVLALALGGVRRRALEPGARSLLELSGVWLASYAAFFVFWVPHNVEFWIPQSVAFWLMLACAWSGARPGAVRAFAALGLALAAVNYAGSIRPAGDLANDFYHAQAQRFAARASARDLIVVGSRWLLPSYLERFADAPVWSLERALRGAASPGDAVASGRALLERTLADGGRVLVAHDVLEPDRELREKLGAPGLLALRALWDDHPPQPEPPAEGLPSLHVIPARASSAVP
jgi:hypothetical protein